MDVSNTKLSPVDFCIMVFWIHGWTTGQIHKWFAHERGKTIAAVRGVINRIGSRRDTMTRKDRQRFLDAMKEARIDGGKLEDEFFKTLPLKSDATALYGPPERQKPKSKKIVYETPDLTTRSGRREAKRLRKEEEYKKAQQEKKQAAREMGGADRGAYTHAFEVLCNSRMLADDWREARRSIDVPKYEGIRKTSGERLRARFDAGQLSGVKSQSFDVMGTSSGKGYSITYRMMEARHDLDALLKILEPYRFKLMERIVRYDEQVWLAAADMDAVLEEIRRSLDCVSLYDGFMSADYFKSRWGSVPIIPKSRARGESKEIAANARAIIEKAQRRV